MLVVLLLVSMLVVGLPLLARYGRGDTTGSRVEDAGLGTGAATSGEGCGADGAPPSL